MTLDFTVPNMACSACQNTITQAIHAVDPTAAVQADPRTKRVIIETQADASTLKRVITAAGYPVA